MIGDMGAFFPWAGRFERSPCDAKGKASFSYWRGAEEVW